MAKALTIKNGTRMMIMADIGNNGFRVVKSR